MSSGRSWPTLGSESVGKDSAKPLPPDVVKVGNLKKLKTMKKKFFVLRGDSIEASARLEYYDTEKKFRSNQPAKRSITLKTCFNINKRSDTKHKNVIALYTKNDCFCIVLESEEELEQWLKELLSLQQGEDIPDGEHPKPTFEHIWQVNVQKKELGNSKNILGPYLLCLTDSTLTLVKKLGTNQQLEFSLQKNSPMWPSRFFLLHGSRPGHCNWSRKSLDANRRPNYCSKHACSYLQCYDKLFKKRRSWTKIKNEVIFS